MIILNVVYFLKNLYIVVVAFNDDLKKTFNAFEFNDTFVNIFKFFDFFISNATQIKSCFNVRSIVFDVFDNNNIILLFDKNVNDLKKLFENVVCFI